ncbi:MAG TPA: hypothetical protein VGD78_19095 [Chthoniobacterales bacterium]
MSTASASKTDPFAAVLALQEKHARACMELAEQIRPESPEGASVLLTMRQRQEAQLRQLMCIHGVLARKDLPTPPRTRAGKGAPPIGGNASPAAVRDPDLERKMFVLQIVQPGLAGLMDGSVSTLAPVFAAAFATHSSYTAFLVGIAASLGAGISMGFAEALSDDGVLSGRGRPWMRGGVCGGMTTLGGIGHTLPFLWPDFYVATWIAVAIVGLELAVIAWIRNRYMDTPLLAAVFQVVLGGFLVFLVGILIGNL